MIHVDTSYLVDLLREARRRQPGPATARLEELGEQEVGASLFVVCELEAGAALAADPTAERRRLAGLLGSLTLVLPGDSLPRIYGSLLHELQRRGETIATMALLIAATALGERAPLLTRNARHFQRVPGLQVLSY